MASSSGVKYDLTFTLSKYLDKHLVRVLLQTLREADIYDEKDIVKTEYDIVSRTHMVDEAADLYFQLERLGYDFGEESKTEEYWEQRREVVLTKLSTLSDDIKDFMDFLYSDAHTIDLMAYKYGGNLRGGGHNEITSETLERFSGGKFNATHVQKLLEYATFLYEAGQYDSGIADLLKYYREFASSTEPRKCRQAKWGQLAADIWRRDWSSAEDLVEDLFSELGDVASNHPRFGRRTVQETALERITQRSWLLHWCLFIYFNNEEYQQLVEKYLMDAKNSSAIRIVCPHLLRYLTVAHFTDIICHNNSHSSTLLDKLGETLDDMKYIYSDPITETVRLYMIDSDFEGASAALAQSKVVMESDFFLRSLTIQWFANVRRLMFKKYTKLCSTIDLGHLNKMLHFDVVPPNPGEGKDVEDWVANIIRRDKIEARIDLTNNLVHVKKGDVCVHQVVIDKMQNINKVKTAALLHTIKSNQILTS